MNFALNWLGMTNRNSNGICFKKRYGLAIQSDVNSKAVIVLMIKVKKLGFRNRKFYQFVHDCQLFLSCCSFFNCLVCLKKDGSCWPSFFVINVLKLKKKQLFWQVDIIVCRQVPEGTGWIMDGFPSTINQAKVTVHQCVLAMLSVCLSEHRTIIPCVVKSCIQLYKTWKISFAPRLI